MDFFLLETLIQMKPGVLKIWLDNILKQRLVNVQDFYMEWEKPSYV